MTQQRQPKGTDTGGQFAADVNPESTVVLDDDRVPTIRHEVAVDTSIASAYGEVVKKANRVDASVTQLRYMIPNSMRTHDRAYMRVDGEYKAANAERLRTMFEAGEIGPKEGYNHDVYAREFVKYDERKAELDVAQEDYREKNKQYEGWSRFFLVPGGHIHSSLNCSTCNKEGKSTNFGWLPDLSGLTEEDAVREHGAILCTVCYPSAPVEYTNQFDLDKAAKAENRCPSSGKYPERDSEGRRSTRCPYCDTRVTVTTNGYIRAHDKQAG
jgi:hypothetical protein